MNTSSSVQFAAHNSFNRDAAIAYAIEHAHVQHVIVLGHYGCKGVEAAITQSTTASSLVRAWVKPIANLYARTRRYHEFLSTSGTCLLTRTCRREIVILRDSRMPRRGLPNGIKAAPAATDGQFFVYDHALTADSPKLQPDSAPLSKRT